MRQEPEYYEDAHGNKIIGNYQGLKFAFSGFNSVVELGENVQFQETVFYIHNDSKILISDNAQLVKNQIYIADYSKAEFGRSVCLRDSNININSEAKMILKRGCIIDRLDLHIGETSEMVLNEEVGVCCNKCIEGRTDWYIGRNAKMKIGSQGCFGGRVGECFLGENALLNIGRKFSINGNYRIILNSNTNIFIGDDCMFSYDISIRSNDGHSIFDITSGKNINSFYNVSQTRKVVIGNHVWVGERVEILYNTKINDGSIIGAMSLVKGKIPNNCIAAGVPARVVRKNIAWCRKEGAENIGECVQEYIHYTEDVL